MVVIDGMDRNLVLRDPIHEAVELYYIMAEDPITEQEFSLSDRMIQSLSTDNHGRRCSESS